MRIDRFREDVDFTAVGFRFGWRNEREGERGWLHLVERTLLAGEKYEKFREFLEENGVFLRNVVSSEEFFFTMVSQREVTGEALKGLFSLVNDYEPDVRTVEVAKTHQIAMVESGLRMEPWREVYEWMFNYSFEWDFREKLGVKEDLQEATASGLSDFFYEEVLASRLLFYSTAEVEVPPFPTGGFTSHVRRRKWRERVRRTVGSGPLKEVYWGYRFARWFPELELVALALGSTGISHLERTARDLLLSWDAEVSCRSDGALLLLYFAYPPGEEEDVMERLERSFNVFSPWEWSQKLAAWARTEFLSLLSGGEDGLMRFVLRFDATGRTPDEILRSLSEPSEKLLEEAAARLTKKPDFVGEVVPP